MQYQVLTHWSFQTMELHGILFFFFAPLQVDLVFCQCICVHHRSFVPLVYFRQQFHAVTWQFLQFHQQFIMCCPSFMLTTWCWLLDEHRFCSLCRKLSAEQNLRNISCFSFCGPGTSEATGNEASIYILLLPSKTYFVKTLLHCKVMCTACHFVCLLYTVDCGYMCHMEAPVTSHPPGVCWLAWEMLWC